MPNPIYTAKATVIGGRELGHGRTHDGKLEVKLRLPKEMGGTEEEIGTNPEQLFAIGYAACFDGALGVVARRERVELGRIAIDSSVGLGPNGSGGFEVNVALDVTLEDIPDAEQARRIVAAAHEVCPYSNATRGNIDVAITVNGQPI